MPQDTARVSIITRTRNRHLLLGRALESVLGQHLEDWQHIVVNDGGNAAELDEFLKPWQARYAGRLEVIHNPTALGMQAASNRALQQARGEFMAVHDDDDAWHPDFLQACVDYLDRQGPASAYQGVVTHTLRVWEDVDSQGQVVEHAREAYLPLHEIQLFRVAYENPFPPIAFVYRRKVHDEIGLWDNGFDVAGDMDFNVRFLLRHEIGVIARPLAYYHWRRSSAAAGLHNSVTAQARDHGRRLNEWLNHYLRSYADKSPEQIGLALNVGHYAVGLQQRADRAIERIEDLKHFVQSVRDGIGGELQALPAHGERLHDLKVHLTSHTHALLEDAIPRLADLKEHLGSLSGIVADIVKIANSRSDELTALAANNIEALQGDAIPRLADLKEHLNSISGIVADIVKIANSRSDELTALTANNIEVLRGDAIPRLADLKEHLGSISGIVAEIVKIANNRSDELTALTANNIEALRGDAIPRLADLKEHLGSVSGAVIDDALPRLAALGEQSSRLSAETLPRLADLKEHLGSVGGALIGDALPRLAQVQEAVGGIEVLRQELGTIRSEMKAEKRLLTIGRLRISWKRRKK